MTRDEGARLLGVAPQTVKNYEKRGFLQPVQGKRADSTGHIRIVTFYDPQELIKLRMQIYQRGKKAQEPIDTSAWLTRNEACEMLSISTQTLKNYEERKKLHPEKANRVDARGHAHMVVVYDPKELANLPRGNGRPLAPRDPGEQEAQGYAMIERGMNNREIVIALRVTSDKVREIRERWENDGGADLMVTTEAKEVLEAQLGPFSDVTELVGLISAKLSPASRAEHGSVPFLTDRQRYALRCLRDFARPHLMSAEAEHQNRCDPGFAWLDALLDPPPDPQG